MRSTTTLAWRAALAIALMVSFYGLALAQGPEAVHAWRTLCERTGIADVDLGAASVSSGSSLRPVRGR